MYRINARIYRKGNGYTEIPVFYVDGATTAYGEEYGATRAALDIIDPMGTIQGNPDLRIEITVN